MMQPLTKEDVAASIFVHDLLEAGTLSKQVKFQFRNPDGMDIATCAASKGEVCGCRELLLLQHFAVFQGSGRSKVSRVTSHDFMQDQHAWVGSGLVDDIGEELGSLHGGGLSTESLLDWVDVIVDGLEKKYKREGES